MSCKSELRKILSVIIKDPNKANKDIPAGKELKFDDRGITTDMLLALFDGSKTKESAVNVITNLMGPLHKKLAGTIDTDLKQISPYVKAVNSTNKVIPYNIALKELLDTQKAEYDKLLKSSNSKVTLEGISDGGVMNVGLARSASVIGRRYLYTLGFRFKSSPETGNRRTPLEIEAKYHALGMAILEDMKADGLVDIVDDGQVINDYFKPEDKELDRKRDHYVKMKVARPKLEALFSKDDFERNGDAYKKQLRGESKKIDSTHMNDVRTLIAAVNNAKIPPMESVPLLKPASKTAQAKNDYMELTPTGKKARDILSSNPVYINDTVIPYFKELAEQWSKSTTNFTTFAKGIAGDNELLYSIFGVNSVSEFSEELSDSIRGQNQSKLVPLEDFLNNINSFTKDDKSLGLYMNYNLVRNARFNMDNSIMNTQGSKYMRHLIGSAQYSIDTTNEDVTRHYIDSIMDQIGEVNIDFGLDKTSDNYDQELFDVLVGNTPNTELEEHITAFNEMIDKPGRWQSNVISNFPSNGNMMATIDTLGAINDLREGLKTGTITTHYNTKSDATASGGSISSTASIGYVKKSLAIIQKLGFLDNNKATLEDIYALLSNRLLGITDPVNHPREFPLSAIEKKSAEKLKRFLDVVYNGNMRDLSKDPTMTFIYNQGKKGAIQTIAQVVTEKLLKRINEPKVAEYVGELLGLDHKPTLEELFERKGMKKELIQALKSNKSVIPSIHAQLTEAVDPLIKDRKEIITDLYSALASLKSGAIKLRTPLAVLDGLENTPKVRGTYGMPLMKLQNILHKTKDGEMVTIENRLNPTTAIVNTTHAQDNAIASLALTRAVKKFKKLYPKDEVPGVSFVHDEFVTSAKLGQILDQEYLIAFKEVVSAYSVEQELLDQIKEINPNHPVVKKHEATIQAANKAKQEALKSFTTDTGKVYGVRKGNYEINTNSAKPSGNTSATKPVGNTNTNTNTTKPDDYVYRGVTYSKKEIENILSRAKEDKRMASHNYVLIEAQYKKAYEAYRYLVKDLQKAHKTMDSNKIDEAQEDVDIQKEEIAGLERNLEEQKAIIKEKSNDVKELEAILNPKKPTPPTSPNGGKPKVKTKEPWKEDPDNPIPFISDTKVKDTNSPNPKFIKKFSDTITSIRNADTTNVTKTLSNLVKTLDVSGIHSELKTKVLNALNGGISATNELREGRLSEVWAGANNKIYVDTRNPNRYEFEIASPEKLLEVLAHEIDHAVNYEYIKANKDSKLVSYLSDVVDHISDADTSKIFDKSRDLYERISYIADASYSKERRITEMVSILSNEPEVMSALVESKVLTETKGKTVVSYIKDLINKAYKYLTDKDIDLFKADNVEHIVQAMQELDTRAKRSNNTSKTLDINNIPKIYQDPLPKDFDTNKNYTKRESLSHEVIIGRTLHTLNSVSRNLLIDNANRLGGTLLGTLDRTLKANFPIYADVRIRLLNLYNESSISPALQELASYTGITHFKNKEIKQDIISRSHVIKNERNAREHKYLSQIEALTKDFSKEGKDELYRLITKTPIHNFFKNDDKFTDSKSIDKEITRLEGLLTSSNNEAVNDTVTMLLTGEVKPKSLYNLQEFDQSGNDYKNMETLIALKSMKEGNLIDSIFNLKKNHLELYTVMKDNSLALYTLSTALHNMSPKGSASSHTLVKEAFKTRERFKAITLHDRRLYDSGEFSGWRIIKEPTKDTLGVVAKRIMDDTFSEGASILEDLPEHDVTVPASLAEKYDLVGSNMIKTGDQYKLVLTDKQKQKAGLLGDMGETLIKSTSNIIAADDAKYIRNKLMEPGLRSVINTETDESIQDIIDKIDDDLIDHPWVLKLGDGVRFDKLPKKIRDRYKPIQQNLSSINGFKGEITHVRKDIRHWLIGGHVPSLFKNPKLQRYSALLKEAIAGSKIGMVMVNPKKLVGDSVSNNTHLSLLGVPFSKILKYQKDIFKDIDSFNTLRNQILQAKMKHIGSPTKESEAVYNDLQNKLKQNGLYTAYKNAFMSSLSSDILSTNAAATEGLQADIHKLLKYFLTNKDGEKNLLHEALGNASRFGMDGTTILEGIGRIADTMNTDGETSKFLNGVAEKLRTIKEDDDMVKYLAQFTVSPDAETVKAGTWANDYMDLVMRETYRRHLLDLGVPANVAIQKSVDMAPFYPEEAPVGIKMLNDYFILPFAPWTTRVHKPVMHILKHRLGTASTEEALVQLLDTDLKTYLESHPLYKVFEGGGLFSSPVEPIGLSSLLPTNLFNF